MTAHRSNDEIKASLIEAASELLRDRGISGVTMSQIADRAGISRTWAYNFYPDVVAIYHDLFHKVQGEFFDNEESVFEDYQSLPMFFERHVDRYLELPVAYAILACAVMNTGQNPPQEVANLRSAIMEDFEQSWIEPFAALGVDRGGVAASVITCQNALFGLVIAMDNGFISYEDARSRLLATIMTNLQVSVADSPELSELFGEPIRLLAVAN
jgi:AcrR family transcriptional regulator